MTYTYDNLGRVKTATYSDGLELTYTYTGEGSLYSVTTEEDGAKTTYIYNYDSLDRLIASERLDGGTFTMRTKLAYDHVNRPVYQVWQLDDTVYSEGYTYNSTEDGSLNTHTTATGQTLTMGYDGLQRLSTITGGIYDKTYTYRDISDTQTTTQVASVAYNLPTAQSFAYTYDNMGNIATYTDANGTVTYTYDAQGQLLSATDGTTTYIYKYDTVGNILEANGHSYTYGDPDWKDLLKAVDGESITYDASGNPTSYYNGTRWTFSWEQGRRLATATDGTTNLSFTYDADGLRTSKTVDGVKHTYLYASGKLLRESYGNTTIDFFYDASGNAYALSHKVGDAEPVVYYYITNLQGDVMSIVDETGAVKATYSYDPYGNIVTATGDLANINPLRYRGYYFDSETGMYYLQSRYYDPEIGRFLSCDVVFDYDAGLQGYDLFAYCGNNPVNRIDVSGADSTQFDDGKQELDETAATGSTPSGSLHALISSITEQLKGCANRANARVSGSGPVAGTCKHTAFANEVNQLNISNVKVEESYIDHHSAEYGTSGSIRFDVVLVDADGNPIVAWDFKTGSARLTASRVNQMQTRSGFSIEIHVVR